MKRLSLILDGKLLALIYILISLAFIALKVTIFRLDETRVFFDTNAYSMVADSSVFDKRFWLRERPFMLPLIYKLFGIHGELYQVQSDALQNLVNFQLVFSIVSWIAFAITLVIVLRSDRAKPVSFLIVLLFGATLDISQWDHLLLSESLSISFFVLFLSLLMLVFQYWKKLTNLDLWIRMFILLIFSSIAASFSFLRDVNSYLLLAVAISFLILGLPVQKNYTKRRLFLCFAGSLVVIFTVQYISMRVGYRWYGPFRNVFYDRIIRDDNEMEIFIARGFPMDNTEIAEMRGYEREQFMERFREGDYIDENIWLRENGRSSYIQLLLSNPLESLIAPLQNLDHIISPDSTEYRNISRDTPRVIELLTGVFFPKPIGTTLVFALLPILGIGLLSRRISYELWWLVPSVLIITCYPLMFLVYHGDAIELERHSMQISMQLRLSGWLFWVAIYDLICFGEYRKRENFFK